MYVCFIAQGPDSVDYENEKWQDVNVVSSLLKLFFRRMPESLVTEGEFQPLCHSPHLLPL